MNENMNENIPLDPMHETYLGENVELLIMHKAFRELTQSDEDKRPEEE